MKARQSEKWLREHLGGLQPSVVRGAMMVRIEDETSGLLRGVLLETSAYDARRFDLVVWAQPLSSLERSIHLDIAERWAYVDLDDEGSIARAVEGAPAAWDWVSSFRDAVAAARTGEMRHGHVGLMTLGEALFGAGDVRGARRAWKRALERARAVEATGPVEHLERLLLVSEGVDPADAQRVAATWAHALLEENRIPEGTVDLAYFDRPRTRRRLFRRQ